MGLGTAISSFATEQARSKPQRILILIVIVIVFILYSQRLLGIEDPYYGIFVVCFMMVVASIIILSTFLSILNVTDNKHVDNFNNIFNSTGSKNFFAIFVLVLFIMFVYEVPMYSNSRSHSIMDKVLFGYNGIFSNRVIGMLLIFAFCITTGYIVYSTTRGDVNVK